MKPYWGKPAVGNFRGGDGDVGIIRSPVRAIALPGEPREGNLPGPPDQAAGRRVHTIGNAGASFSAGGLHRLNVGPSLWGHAIALPETVGGGIRLVDRTNLLLEAFFHGVKHGERRRSGRKTLTQDLENLPAAALIATNLEKADYVERLCGSLDQLPAAFARLDAEDRSLALPLRQRDAVSEISDLVSASPPAADRDIIRSEGLQHRILAAARSRAPRRPGTAQSRAATVG